MKYFIEWKDSDNVMEISKGVFTTQDTLWKNRIHGLYKLYEYWNREFN